MNHDPSTRPDEEASDPLLAALRQQLGDYGQAPPPGTWASIEQRLRPAAAPVAARAKWQKLRRLSLVLLLSLVAVVLTLKLRPGRLGNSLPAASVAAPGRPVVPPARLRPPDQLVAPQPAPAGASPAAPASRQAADVSVAARPPAGGQLAGEAAAASSRPSVVPLGAGRRSAPRSRLLAQPIAGPGVPLARAEPARYRRPILGHAAPNPRRSRQSRLVAKQLPIEVPVDSSAAITTAAGRVRRALRAGERLTAGQHPPVRPARPVAFATAPPQLAAISKRYLAPKTPSTPDSAEPGRATADRLAKPSGATPPAARLAGRAPGFQLRRSQRLAAPSVDESSVGYPPGTGARTRSGRAALLVSKPESFSKGLALDSLPGREAVVALCPPPPLPSLAARPNSARPDPALVRRWSLLVVAGPTLSYRTLPPAANAPPVIITGTGNQSSADQERPAAGLGGQVQARVVLSGRWALAAGLGYQQYAAGLNLRVRRPGDSLLHPIQLRDTYQLLTVPVQASYALGAPRGRLAAALLVGAEPSWYRGGRSTEGSSCQCQQQTLTPAANPYYAWSLGLSLGLDLRWHLGGAASRWSLVAQPTGRYLLTPFVRPNTEGYASRQPYSLGLFTGLAWDFR